MAAKWLRKEADGRRYVSAERDEVVKRSFVACLFLNHRPRRLIGSDDPRSEIRHGRRCYEIAAMIGWGGSGLMQTIALVDDDEDVLTSVSIALELEGYNVITYRDGASALVSLKTSPPDLAVLEIKMPRMDGMEMLRRLRETSRVPVIFLTCKNDEIDEVLGLKMGADDFIRKPFSQRVLAERVKAVLRRGTEKDDSANIVIERGIHCVWT